MFHSYIFLILKNMKLVLVHILMLLSAIGDCQSLKKVHVINYRVNEGLLQTTISDLEIDKNNFYWVSFPNGLQKFDGTKFYDITIQAGLPDDANILFFKCRNGNLLLSHKYGISEYNIENNTFEIVWKNTFKNQLNFIGEYNGRVYLYNSEMDFIGIDLKNKTKTVFIVNSLPKLLENSQPILTKNIIDGKFSFLAGGNMYLYDLKNYSYTIRRNFPLTQMRSILMLNSDEVVYSIRYDDNSIGIYNFKTNSWRYKMFPKNLISLYYSNFIFKYKNNFLLANGNDAFVIDSSLEKVLFKLTNFQNQPVVDKSTIRDIHEDNFGNLIAITIIDGLKKFIVNNYQINYFGNGDQKDNHCLAILADKNKNRIFVSSLDAGVTVYDTLQNILKKFEHIPGTSIKLTVNRIVRTPVGEYIFYLSNFEKALWISSDLKTIKVVRYNRKYSGDVLAGSYFGNILYEGIYGNITQGEKFIFKTSYANREINVYNFTDEYILSGLIYNDKLVLHRNEELVFYDTVNFSKLKTIPFPNTSKVRCFAKDVNGIIYIGSNKGIFITDTTGKIYHHLTKASGLPDECIYSILIDKTGTLWCSSNKGIFAINKAFNILRIDKSDGLQENEFNTNVASVAADGEFYFGGVNGVSAFFPQRIMTVKDSISMLLTKIRINNFDRSGNINDKLILDHNQKFISFDFVAMGHNNPNQYIYQYKLDGVDNGWIQSEPNQPVRYMLSPGKYKFHLYASRFFNKDALPLKTLEIIVKPPFYKTWWFAGLSMIILFAAIIYGVNRYNRSKYQKKLLELENENKLQLERERISRDLHDNIGAFANAVLHKAEILQNQEEGVKKNDLMSDLKYASKEIIISLRETIWAFKNSSYSTDECMVRIKNFTSSLRRYYPAINLSVHEKMNTSFFLRYVDALNIVRIIQEAITNAVKHSGANEITVRSVINDNQWEIEVTDNGKGFNPHEVIIGNGLDNIRKRSDTSKFNLSINSANRSGTTIKVLIKKFL